MRHDVTRRFFLLALALVALACLAGPAAATPKVTASPDPAIVGQPVTIEVDLDGVVLHEDGISWEGSLTDAAGGKTSLPKLGTVPDLNKEPQARSFTVTPTKAGTLKATCMFWDEGGTTYYTPGVSVTVDPGEIVSTNAELVAGTWIGFKYDGNDAIRQAASFSWRATGGNVLTETDADALQAAGADFLCATDAFGPAALTVTCDVRVNDQIVEALSLTVAVAAPGKIRARPATGTVGTPILFTYEGEGKATRWSSPGKDVISPVGADTDQVTLTPSTAGELTVACDVEMSLKSPSHPKGALTVKGISHTMKVGDAAPVAGEILVAKGTVDGKDALWVDWSNEDEDVERFELQVDHVASSPIASSDMRPALFPIASIPYFHGNTGNSTVLVRCVGQDGVTLGELEVDLNDLARLPEPPTRTVKIPAGGGSAVVVGSGVYQGTGGDGAAYVGMLENGTATLTLTDSDGNPIDTAVAEAVFVPAGLHFDIPGYDQESRKAKLSELLAYVKIPGIHLYKQSPNDPDYLLRTEGPIDGHIVVMADGKEVSRTAVTVGVGAVTFAKAEARDAQGAPMGKDQTWTFELGKTSRNDMPFDARVGSVKFGSPTNQFSAVAASGLAIPGGTIRLSKGDLSAEEAIPATWITRPAGANEVEIHIYQGDLTHEDLLSKLLIKLSRAASVAANARASAGDEDEDEPFILTVSVTARNADNGAEGVTVTSVPVVFASDGSGSGKSSGGCDAVGLGALAMIACAGMILKRKG